MSLIGTILPYAGTIDDSTRPNLRAQGFLLCDGSAVSRQEYLDLWIVIRDTWGPGDNINTFNLPDLRGYFMRGVDHGAGHDPEASARQPMHSGSEFAGGDYVGSLQMDSFASHNHGYEGVAEDTNTWKGGGKAEGGYVVNLRGQDTDPTGGSETRPKNVNVEFLIQYK